MPFDCPSCGTSNRDGALFCNMCKSVFRKVSSAAASPAAPRPFVVRRVEPKAGELAAVLRTEAAQARAAGRRPFIELFDDACPPSRAIARSLDHALVREAFRGVHVVQLDVEQWEDPLTEMGLPVHAIPAFFEIGADGRPTGRSVDGGAWDADTPEGMAPVLGAFFQGVATPGSTAMPDGMRALHAALGAPLPRTIVGYREEPAPRLGDPPVGSVGDARGLLARGIGLLDAERVDDAMLCFERASEVAPELPEAWRWRGATLHEIGRHADALACLERALSLDPSDGATWYDRARVEIDLGRRDAAARSLTEAVSRIDPRRHEALAAEVHALLARLSP